MTNSELSNEFDVLYNNITSNQAPGLNEYEKSVFLTKAQSQLVNEYFNNRTDGFGGGFDGSQKRQYDFSSIIKVVELSDLLDDNLDTYSIKKIDKRSKVFIFPNDYFLAINEIIATDSNGVSVQYSVLPINNIEYQKLMLKPYALPHKKAVWRLINRTISIIEDDITSTHSVIECIGNFEAGNSITYKLRYIKTLNPIILEDLNTYGEDVSIGGKFLKTQCELPEETHQEILERAVTLAKVAWQGTTVTQQAAQQRDRE